MSSKFIIIRVLLFVLLVVGTTSAMIAQDNDFTTWTKFKVNHKIDSRFAVSGNLELRTEDDMSAIDRWGISVGSSDTVIVLELRPVFVINGSKCLCGKGFSRLLIVENQKLVYVPG